MTFPRQLSWGSRQPAPTEGEPQEPYSTAPLAPAGLAAQWLAALRVFARRHPVVASVAGVMALKTTLQLTGLDFCFIRIP